MATDPLPSWNDGANKRAIVEFVAAVSQEGGPDFVPAAERIATFDNDGTLWTEQPLYTQMYVMLDQINSLTAQHPEWQSEQPYAAILAGDRVAMKQIGEAEVGKIVAAAHSGMTTDQFEEQARTWVATARRPVYDRLYTECVYQPMIELLDYRRANGFRTSIVSGGGIDLMRTFAEETYGIPPHQTAGSSGKVAYSLEAGLPTLTKLPEVNSIDDKEGKPINIYLHIGKKPILAGGSSDGDLEMLRYATSGAGPRLMLYIHHDDGVREVAYDRDSHIGKFDTGWDEATARGWNVVSMKDDWNRVFSFDA